MLMVFIFVECYNYKYVIVFNELIYGYRFSVNYYYLPDIRISVFSLVNELHPYFISENAIN